MTHKRLLVAVVLLAASGVLAQTNGQVTLEQQCSHLINNCAFLWDTATTASAQGTASPPSPVWVADPSAGHYDCPDGWMAYTRSEPDVYRFGGYAAPAMLIPPDRDKKGHPLNRQPPSPICIQERP